MLILRKNFFILCGIWRHYNKGVPEMIEMRCEEFDNIQLSFSLAIASNKQRLPYHQIRQASLNVLIYNQPSG
jgi:hypothetical protein